MASDTQKALLVIGITVFFGLGFILAALDISGVFSVTEQFGEEGYEPLSPALSADVVNPNDWRSSMVGCELNYNLPNACKNPDRNSLGKHAAAQEGDITFTGDPYQVIAFDYIGRDLSLEDIRLNVHGVPHLPTGNKAIATTYTFQVLEGKEAKTIFTRSVSKEFRSAVSYNDQIEILWTALRGRGYQIKLNGQADPVYTGTLDEGEQFSIRVITRGDYCSDCNAQYGSSHYPIVTLENPRGRPIFKCDPKDGQVKVNYCVGGPDVLKTTDLPGYESFCPNLPATLNKDGVIAADKQIYYDLASQESLVIETNEFWEFQYLAKGSAVGFVTDETGIVDLCKQDDGGIEILNLVDRKFGLATVDGGTVTWNGGAEYNGDEYREKNLVLKSRDKNFMTISDISIKCETTKDTQRYPRDGQDSSCYTVTAFSEEFTDGQTRVIDGVSVTMKNLDVQYKSTSRGTAYSWKATWTLEFGGDEIQVRSVTADDVRVGYQGVVSVDLQNNLPGDVSINTLGYYNVEGINQLTTRVKKDSLKRRVSSIIEVPQETGFVGSVDVIVAPTVIFNGQALVFGQGKTSYEILDDEGNIVGDRGIQDSNPVVVSEDEIEKDATKNEPTGEQDNFLARFWEWVKEFVGGLFR